MLTDPQPPQLTAPPAPDPPYWKGGVQDDDRLPARSRRYWQGRLQPSPPRFDFAGKALAPATLRASRRPDWQRGAGWLAALSRARVAIKRTSLAGLLLPAGETSSSDGLRGGLITQAYIKVTTRLLFPRRPRHGSRPFCDFIGRA
jgi:hypothetical protein